MNTTDFLNIATAICPDRAFLVFEGQKQTFAETNERINRLAHALGKMGIRKADHVGMLHVNCPQYVEAYFAAAKLGAVFVPLNFRAKADELSYMINHAGIRALFVGGRYMEMVNGILGRLTSVEECIAIDEKQQKWPFYEDLISSSPADDIQAEIEDEALTILMYTAGTTGRPKGVPLRHSGFTSYVLENIDPADPEVEERNLLTVPLYHVAGIQAMLAGVYGGRTLVIMQQFEVKEWMRTIQAQRVSRAMLVPTMLKWVIDDPEFDKYDLSSLRVVTYGAAPMPFEVIKKAIEMMPWVHFINAFGQTETASTITVLGPEDHRIEGTQEEREKKLNRLAASIGRPLPDVEVKIVDEQGRELAPLQVGEILAKGSRIMSGYWGEEEKTKQILTTDGWLRTGDQGWKDKEGYIFLAGRGDDMIIRGGENISPEEVENVLYAHPKVEEAAVIGMADSEWGQQVRAVVAIKEGQEATAEELMEFCRSRLAGFKRPRSVVFVDTLPRNPMGKILKRELRTRYGQ
jgi:acyl-CoA synthetase (AMP-forming)/AMP-acid ligase II